MSERNAPESGETGIDYSSLGYVTNPFPPFPEQDTSDYWMHVLARAEANRLASAIVRADRDGKRGPIWADFSADVPGFYVRTAQNQLFGMATRNPVLSMLSWNVPLEMMRFGPVRGTVIETAELVAAVDFHLTLGAWMRRMLAEPDTSLPEYSAIEPILGQLREQFAGDLTEAVSEHVAPPEIARQDDVSTDRLVHAAYLKQIEQDLDPAEADVSKDGAPADEMDDEAASVGLAVADEPAEEAEEQKASPLYDYLLAYTRAHLSPVIARGIKAYVAEGTAMVAQELKITKAPKKTLRALLKFMGCRWERLVVMYDKFDSWPLVEDDERVKVLGAMAQLRYTLGADAVMVVLAQKSVVPEIAEQFLGAEQLAWDFPGLVEIYELDPKPLDLTLVQGWLDAAALDGSAIRADVDLGPLVEAAKGEMVPFAHMAEAAFRDAASRGATTIDAEAIEAGLSVIG